jgi:glycogen(starch) synthase
VHIAFVTPEFVTDYCDGGGLGTYLNRIARLLVQRQHKVEIILASDLAPGVLDYEGIRVLRVQRMSKTLAIQNLRRVCRVAGMGMAFEIRCQARALAKALEQRHREDPFQIVQSADYFAVGLCVPKRNGRVHLVRCSTAADLYNQADQVVTPDGKWREKLERASMRRADKVYAPSQFIADHFRTRHGLNVEVVRPPAGLEIRPSKEPPCGLPDRFLLHFGQLSKRKGTHWLARAFALVCEAEPSARMVWIGRSYGNELAELLRPLAQYRSRVQVLYPLPKPELLAVLQRAEAAVLPSLVDNLPNTVIESLRLGIPVIGTQGASIDELVQPGLTGELVGLEDVKGLASAMLKIWRKQGPLKKGFAWLGGPQKGMEPDRAVEALLRFAVPGQIGTGQQMSSGSF